MSYLEKHGANKWHLSVDRSTTKYIASSKGQWDVLNHISQVFEIPNVAHEVQRIIDGAEINKNVLLTNTLKVYHVKKSQGKSLLHLPLDLTRWHLADGKHTFQFGRP